MTIYYAKLVTTSSYNSATDTLEFALASNGQVRRAKWATDVKSTASDEHTISPTIVTTTPQTGWLWLSETWITNNGLYSSVDPKRPKAYPIGAAYYETHGRVVGVSVFVLLDEDRSGQPVRVNLYDGAQIRQNVPLPSAELGKSSSFWLTGGFLAAATDVDFAKLGPPAADAGVIASAQLIARVLGIDAIDPLLILEYSRARAAARKILQEYAAFRKEPDPDPLAGIPVEAVESWRAEARDAGMK